MEWFRGWKMLVLALWVAGIGSACNLGSRTGQSEERDPHFLEGESREASKDFKGAAEAFHRAIENNPRNASAHKRLGFLYSQQLNQPDAAIYHFQRLLEYRKSEIHKDLVNDHILRCRQRLAQTLAIGAFTRQNQEEFLRLSEENARLQKLVAALTLQIQQLQRSPLPAPSAISFPPAASNQTLDQGLSPAPLGQSNSSSNLAVLPKPSSGPAGRSNRELPAKPTSGIDQPSRSTAPPSAANSPSKPSAAQSGRYSTHKVRSGETFASIAKQRGTTARALILANPNIDPRRLKAGQTIVIPQL